MKRVLLCCLLICSASYLLGQKVDTIIKVDTINVRGYVYDYNNQPVKNIGLMLGFYLAKLLPDYPTKTTTDNNGYFEFKGVDPEGWIKFTNGKYYLATFPIKGSRYMVIYLPQEQVINVNPRDSVIVLAKRQSPKNKSSFKITLNKGLLIDVIEKQPEFIGGNAKFIKYLQQNIIYPEAAIKNNIEGTVEIEFSFERGGTLTNFKTIKGIGYGCDDQVIEQIKKAGKWRPGIYNGEPVFSRENVAVQFKLTD